MAAVTAENADELSNDITTPLDISQCSRGWETQSEHSYWIPQTDIEGEIPRNLYGTLFRNGPGVNEVYGKSLKHRKFMSISFMYVLKSSDSSDDIMMINRISGQLSLK